MTIHNDLVHELLDTAADTWPKGLAIETKTQSVTFSELRSQATIYAHWLRRHGVVAGSRIVIEAESSISTVAAIFGLLALGAAFCPLHPSAPPRQRTYVSKDVGAALTMYWLDGELVTESGTGILRVPSVGAGGDASESACPLSAIAPGTISEDLACLFYTSGSTGRPKGVTCLHRQVRFAVDAVAVRLDYRQEDTIFVALPLSFDYGLYQVLLGLKFGAVVHLAKPCSAGLTLVKELVTTKTTVLPAVAPMLDNLTVFAHRQPEALHELRLITNTGADVAPATVETLRASLPNLRFQLMYGLTECKRVTINPPDADLIRPGTCGLPLPGTSVRIVDDNENEVPAGHIGQIMVRGPHVMAGYWNNDALTSERFALRHSTLRELRTGDYGWRDSDGFLFFSGRKDEIFKQRGFRVSCSEIEASARALDGITCAALIPPQGKRQSTLFVKFENEEFDVIARLRDELEEYKLPGRCITLEAMPITANGKIDRRVLKTIAHDCGHATESSMTINATAAREALREAVSKVLGEEVPPLLDEMSMFEELRMDSTTMLETLMELESMLGFEVNPEELDIEDFLTVGAYVKFLVDVEKRQSAPAA